LLQQRLALFQPSPGALTCKRKTKSLINIFPF
jgi:hypothetical protein